jgi:hypothetical protein
MISGLQNLKFLIELKIKKFLIICVKLIVKINIQ